MSVTTNRVINFEMGNFEKTLGKETNFLHACSKVARNEITNL